MNDYLPDFFDADYYLQKFFNWLYSLPERIKNKLTKEEVQHG